MTGDSEDQKAIDILTRMAAQVEAEGRGGRHIVTASNGGVELADVPPFSAWKERDLHLDLWGNRVPFWQSLGGWAVRRLERGQSPSDIIAAAHGKMGSDHVDVLAVFAIEGLSVPRTVPFAEGSWLMPPEALPDGWNRNHSFRTGALPFSLAHARDNYYWTSDRCALVTDETIKPLSSPSTAPRAAGVPDGNGIAADVARSLSLATDVWVTMASRYAVLHADDFGAELAGVVHSPIAMPPRKSPEPDIGKAKAVLARIRRFNEKDEIRLAIDRVIRSRQVFSDVDKALDLGVAAEVLLMGGKGQDNSEITNKLGMRSAWLLGRTPSDRQVIMAEMKKLYGVRSSAAHRGAVKDGFDAVGAEGLVVRMIAKLLRMGRFPDWDALVLGTPSPMPPDAKLPKGLPRAPPWPS